MTIVTNFNDNQWHGLYTPCWLTFTSVELPPYTRTSFLNLIAANLANGSLYKALFDFDGTLIDSIPVYNAFSYVLSDSSPDDFLNNICNLSYLFPNTDEDEWPQEARIRFRQHITKRLTACLAQCPIDSFMVEQFIKLGQLYKTKVAVFTSGSSKLIPSGLLGHGAKMAQVIALADKELTKMQGLKVIDEEARHTGKPFLLYDDHVSLKQLFDNDIRSCILVNSRELSSFEIRETAIKELTLSLYPGFKPPTPSNVSRGRADGISTTEGAACDGPVQSEAPN
jgi:phosphoglycolate phosphatase-like HAD superfamily hydrolase